MFAAVEALHYHLLYNGVNLNPDTELLKSLESRT